MTVISLNFIIRLENDPRSGRSKEVEMLSMNRELRTTKILITVLLMIGLALLTGCHHQKPVATSLETERPDNRPGILIITGNGVEHQTRFTLTELKNMEEALSGECYSTVNNWPAKKYYVGKGVKVSYLLKKAGIKNTAQMIIVRAADGYNATFTREQLEEKRFCYPNLLEGSEEGAREVPAILAWEHWEGTSDLSKATSGNLCLLLGQKGLNDVVTPAYVKDVITLEVLTTPPGQWGVVQAEPAPGKVKQGTDIVLSHPEQDRVKIYYTIDGTTPDDKSLVYNPSTTYYQPELIKPITVDKTVIIKAMVIGFGKHNSQVATFKYDVE